MVRKLTELLSLPLTLVLIALMLLRSAILADAAFSSMQLAATVVVPTLFPFAVLSSFLVLSGAAEQIGRRWGKPIARLFQIERSGAAAWILGTLCGCPIGASVISGLYAKKQITKECAERMLPYCNNAGPAFLVAVVGGRLLQSSQAGWLLLAVHAVSSVLVGLAFRQGPAESAPEPHPQKSEPLSGAFTAAVRNAAVTMVHISGFIVLFSVVLSLLRPLFPQNALLTSLLSGIFELTNGLYALSAVSLPLHVKFMLSAGLLGWSGLCVHFQVLSLTLPLGLSAKPYLLGKLLQGLFSMIAAMPVSVLLRRQTLPAAAMSPASLPAFLITFFWALFSCALFFTFLWKSRSLFAIIKKTKPGGQ